MQISLIFSVGWPGLLAPMVMEVGSGDFTRSTESQLGAGSAVATIPRRVLVVEDSFMSARVLVRMIEELGVKVIGPAPSVRQAMMLLDQERCDGAILDINLGNETVEPVAKRLADAGVPFFFVSGYSSPKLMDARFRSHKLLSKPLDPGALKRAVADAFGPSTG
jgi:two-component SAPR family response regulator